MKCFHGLATLSALGKCGWIQSWSRELSETVFIKKGNGFTLKTREFSYTEYIKSKDNSIIARMLYDHRVTKTENVNIVNKKEFKNIVLELNSILHLKYQKNIEGN